MGHEDTADGGTRARRAGSAFGVELIEPLGGRASRNWSAHREAQQLVLRLDEDLLGLGRERLGEAIAWRGEVRARAADHGWPVPVDVAPPIWSDGWWTLETFRPGSPAALAPERHARLLDRWLQPTPELLGLGPQPHRLRHLDVLSDGDVDVLIRRVDDADDRRWLALRLDQARALAAGIDWDVSPTRLVHGDLVSHNLLWEQGELSGVIDFELATVDRRVVELIHVWRCRYDDVLLTFDTIAPLHEHEWRMLLVDW